MEKRITHFVVFNAPGAFVGETFEREVASSDPRAVEWPKNAYAFSMFEREVVIDGKEVYKGKAKQVGKTYYHPDSKVETLAEAKKNPKATPILISNMECNGWDRIVWSRWGNWPQPFDPNTETVIPKANPMTDTKDDVELPERSAQNVMMSAHALCPTDMSHPERMAWMADYFMREYARQAVRMERERCARLCEQEGDIVRKGISVMGMHLGMRDPTVYDELVAAIRKGESRG